MNKKSKRKTTAVICLVSALLLLICACNDNAVQKEVEEIPEDAVPVSLAITQDKTLSSDINDDIKYWEFMATPKFELADNEYVYGQVSYWRTLPELDTGSDNKVKTTCDLGRYTSGNWYFELRALNSNHHVVAVGSTTEVVRAGIDNVIDITMHRDDADLTTHGQSWDVATSGRTQVTENGAAGVASVERYGSVHIGFVANQLDWDTSKLQLVLTRQKVNKYNIIGTAETLTPTWTIRTPGEAYTKWYKESTIYENEQSGDSDSKVEDARMYFECEIPDHDAGSYVYTIQIQAKSAQSGSFITIAGQSVDVQVLGGEETMVKGTMLANTYILTSLSLNETGEIYGTINGETYHKSQYDSPIALKWSQTAEQKAASKEEAVKFYWFANGDEIVGENSDTLSFECPHEEDEEGNATTYYYGLHRVTIVAVGDQGSLGSASIDLIFNPKEGASLTDDDYQYPWSDNDYINTGK